MCITPLFTTQHAHKAQQIQVDLYSFITKVCVSHVHPLQKLNLTKCGCSDEWQLRNATFAEKMVSALLLRGHIFNVL
jgi:hypothetical protein